MSKMPFYPNWVDSPSNGTDPSIWNSLGSSIRNVDLELVFYGREQCVPGKNWGPGVKNHYKVHYIHNGKGTIHVGDQIHSAQAGECFVFYPDTKVYYEADTEDPWAYSWVAFEGMNAEFYLLRAGIGRDRIVIHECNAEVLEDAFSYLMSVDTNDVNKDMKYISSLYMILSAITSVEGDSEALQGQRRSANYIKMAVKYIQANYAQPITVEEIAAYLCLERKYFSRIFKEAVSVSPSTYISAYRLTKACDLLEKRNLTIGEIALSVGYENPFSFSRAFKKMLGVSPTEYQQNCPS